jgi:hypothetical protein
MARNSYEKHNHHQHSPIGKRNDLGCNHHVRSIDQGIALLQTTNNKQHTTTKSVNQSIRLWIGHSDGCHTGRGSGLDLVLALLVAENTNVPCLVLRVLDGDGKVSVESDVAVIIVESRWLAARLDVKIAVTASLLVNLDNQVGGRIGTDVVVVPRVVAHKARDPLVQGHIGIH